MDILFNSLEAAIISFKDTWQVFAQAWFFILPAPFFYLFKYVWLKHVQKKHLMSLNWVLLEIIPPRDIERGPQPMESVFNGMTGSDKGLTPIEEFVQGILPVSYSLEIVSIGGTVHFFVRVQKPFRNLIEANIYAQYPNAEIIEAPDYINNVPKIIPNKMWDLWGVDLALTKDDAYPINTYPNFEESISGTMIDPLSSVVEAMGKIAPDQQIWLQLIVTPEKADWNVKKGRVVADLLAGKKPKEKKSFFSTLFNDIVDILKHVVPAAYGPIEFEGQEKEKEQAPLEFRLTPGEKEVLKAVERNISKSMFRTKMRFLCLGKRENFTKATVSSVMGAVRQFNDFNLNGFKPDDGSKTYANFIFVDSRTRWRQRKILKRYKDRDPDGVKFSLSTEELATIFHMPDISVVAPSVTKTDFKRGGAPANLPVG